MFRTSVSPSTARDLVRCRHSAHNRKPSLSPWVCDGGQPKDLGLPTKAYCCIDDVQEDGTQRAAKTFAHVQSEVGAYEAEEIGVEHLLRDVKDAKVRLSFSEKVLLRTAPCVSVDVSSRTARGTRVSMRTAPRLAPLLEMGATSYFLQATVFEQERDCWGECGGQCGQSNRIDVRRILVWSASREDITYDVSA